MLARVLDRLELEGHRQPAAAVLSPHSGQALVEAPGLVLVPVEVALPDVAAPIHGHVVPVEERPRGLDRVAHELVERRRRVRGVRRHVGHRRGVEVVHLGQPLRVAFPLRGEGGEDDPVPRHTVEVLLERTGIERCHVQAQLPRAKDLAEPALRKEREGGRHRLPRRRPYGDRVELAEVGEDPLVEGLPNPVSLVVRVDGDPHPEPLRVESARHVVVHPVPHDLSPDLGDVPLEDVPRAVEVLVLVPGLVGVSRVVGVDRGVNRGQGRIVIVPELKLAKVRVRHAFSLSRGGRPTGTPPATPPVAENGDRPPRWDSQGERFAPRPAQVATSCRRVRSPVRTRTGPAWTW